jgi:hypothetical protein
VIAAVGHLPPPVVDADGSARYLEVDPGLPLGVGLRGFVEQATPCSPASGCGSSSAAG